MKRYVVAMLVVLGLSACATPDTYDETRGWTVEHLYAEAHDELNSGNYTRAVKLYEALEARFPYGRYSQQAQMDLAYTHYRDNEPELAVAACDRFIKLHPTHANIDYIYYLKGLIYFNDGNGGALAKWGGQDMSERDPKAQRESYLAFSELVRRFPDSKYYADGKSKLVELVNAMGGHEMHVARYYMKRGDYIAAANRAQVVIKDYSNTPYQEEALALMTTAYHELGMIKLADDSRRVLAMNYPKSAYLNSPWALKELPWWKFWN